MTYETLTERNITQVGDYFDYANDLTSGIFVSMFLFSFFMIILIGGYYTQKRLDGSANFLNNLVVASYLTTILSVLLSFIAGLIPATTIFICAIISVLTTLWLYYEKDN